MARPLGHKHDQIDDKIVTLLEENPDLEIKEIAKKIGLTYSPCQKRVQNLVKSGHLTKSGFSVRKKGLGGFSHFVQVFLNETSTEVINFVAKKISSIKEVEFCLELNGSIDLVVVINSDDIKEFERIRNEIEVTKLNDVKVVKNTTSRLITRTFK